MKNNEGSMNNVIDFSITKKLGDIARIINGKSVSRDGLSEHEGIPYLRGRNLSNGRIVNASIFVKQERVKSCSRQILEEGDILLQKYFGQYKLAKVTIEDLPAIASNMLIIIRPYAVTSEYLYQCLTSKTGYALFTRQLEAIEKGGVIPSITLKDLNEISIPIFDCETRIKISNLDEQGISELIPRLIDIYNSNSKKTNTPNRENDLIAKVYRKLEKKGWDHRDIADESGLARHCINIKREWKPDIILYNNDEILAVIELKKSLTDFLSLRTVDILSDVIASQQVPLVILSDGTYYEVHNSRNGTIKKLYDVPTKAELLNIYNQGGNN